MDRARKISIDYLSQPPNGFWMWSDDGEVVTWPNGQTIAFRAEVAQILGGLTSTGLPPLGSVLLLIAATRESWVKQSVLDALQADWKTAIREDFFALVAALEGVRRLEAGLRTSIEAKITLAQVVFENASHRTSPTDALAIVKSLEHSLDEGVLNRGDPQRELECEWYPSPFDLAGLQAGLRHVNPKTLKLRQQTGLDELPESPGEIEIPYSDRVRSLLVELKQDDDYTAMAQLAFDLMAAVTVPRPVANVDEQQVGGISDITNRGPLDRLLLSELAHDDLTLAVRVAVNEALYLRRESPPSSPPQNRVILLDAGIRNWGIPRVFATSVALALAAMTDKNSRAKAYRFDDGKLVDVDLATREGLKQHLAALDTAIHPGPSLPLFQSTLSEAESAAEPVLVLTCDTWDDEQFQHSLREHLAVPFWAACLHRDGTLELLERTVSGTRVVKTVRLNLSDLFASKEGPPLVDDSQKTDLPAAISVKPFPLLMPHNVDPKKTWLIEGATKSVLSIANDSRLTHWTSRERGGRQIAQNVPRGALWWASCEWNSDIAYAVVGHMAPTGLRLLEINIRDLSCSTRRLVIERGARGIAAHGGVLFAIYPNRVQVVNPHTGLSTQTLDLPTGMRWVRERFFRSTHPTNEQWFALSFDGTSAGLELVCETPATAPQLLTLVERVGVDGPIGLTASGDLYFTSTRQTKNVLDLPGTHASVHEISRDGRSVTLHLNGPSGADTSAIIDLEAESAERYSFHPKALIIQRDYNAYVDPRNIRHRFNRIFVDEDGGLNLITRKESRYVITTGAQHMILRPQTESIRRYAPIAFVNHTSKDELGFRLSRAVWKDGSEAFLDTRGLLHLKSANINIPELCIVLTSGPLSGWCADGRYWGDRYFVGDSPLLAPPEDIMATIQQFTRHVK